MFIIFLRKFWRLTHDSDNNFSVSKQKPTSENLKTLHKTIKKIQEDIERYSFNTVVSTLMICINELTEQKCHNQQIISDFTILLFLMRHILQKKYGKNGKQRFNHQSLFSKV